MADLNDLADRLTALEKDLTAFRQLIGGGAQKVDVTLSHMPQLEVNVLRTTTNAQRPIFERLSDSIKAIGADRYEQLINAIFDNTYEPDGADPYEQLEGVTKLFLLTEMGTRPGEAADTPEPRIKDKDGKWKTDPRGRREKFLNARLDSMPEFQGWSGDFKTKVKEAFKGLDPKLYPEDPPGTGYGVAEYVPGEKLFCELIYSFFAEIGGVRQAEGAILLRYQNQRIVGNRGEALTQLNIESSDWINAWLRGRIAAYQQRKLTSLPDRAAEYFNGIGVNVLPPGDGVHPAEVRSRLIPALLGLVQRLLIYYKDSDNKLMAADGEPVLHALRELQLAADEAEANRAYDMPLRLRKELLVAQAILGHPTLTRTLVARSMVRRAGKYQGVVEAVKDQLGWGLPDIAHYHELAAASEILVAAGQVKLWVRETEPQVAAALAEVIRGEAKAFAHAYKAITGVELGSEETHLSLPPAMTRVPDMAIAGRAAAARLTDTNGRARLPGP